MKVMGHLGKRPGDADASERADRTSFSIATSNDYKDKSSGEWQKKTLPGGTVRRGVTSVRSSGRVFSRATQSWSGERAV